MDTSLHGPDGHRLLLASALAPEAGGLVLRYEEVPAADGTEQVTLWVTDLDGNPPDEASQGYWVMARSSLPNILDLSFKTADARDVVAFVVAYRNEQRALQGLHADIPLEDTFSHEDIQVHNPFLELTYGDWAVQAKPDGVVHLADPRELYGDAYLSWRDGLAGRLTPAPTPVEPEPPAPRL